MGRNSFMSITEMKCFYLNPDRKYPGKDIFINELLIH